MPFHRSRLFASLLSLVVLAGASTGPLVAPVSAAPVQAGFRETVVLSALTNPTAVEFAPDGRVFVSEKSGLIKVFPELGSSAATVFADLRTEVHNYWDRGLLSMALHPDFPNTPYVYALFTHDAAIGGTAPRWGDACPNPPGGNGPDGCHASGRLVRLTASGNVSTGRTTLITDWCVQFPSHTIADLTFGPDGMLYVSAGDGANFNTADYGQFGGSAGSPVPRNPCGDPPTGSGTVLTPPTAEGGALRSQDLRTSGDQAGLDGSVIRIDPITGAAAPENPLIGSPDPMARRIVAHGFRNPFRMAFRPGTSELWIGDVGWNAYEEIDRITNLGAPVENFGWPCYEGGARQASYDNANLAMCENLYSAGASATTAPWHAYHHADRVVTGETCPTGGSALAGMAFYDGTAWPAAYRGALFFADYTRNCIWAALPSSPGGMPSAANLQTFVTGAAAPIDLVSGPGGDLYYVAFGDPSGQQANGSVRRLHYAPGNQPPNAVAVAAPAAGQAPLSVSFDATNSSDPDPGDVLSYAWDLDDDGSFDDGTGATASRTYQTDGTRSVRLRVTDSAGGTDVDTISLSVGNSPPVLAIGTPSASLRWRVNQTISFSGSAHDGEGTPLPASALRWSLVQHHCPSNCHQHPIQSWNGVATGSFAAPDHEYPSHLELILTARDPQGLERSTSVALDPQTVTLNLASSPSGAELSIGTTSDEAPFSVTAIVGSQLGLSAPAQAIAGAAMDFASWSDGGAATHTITVPASTTTYTAAFALDTANAAPVLGPLSDEEAYEGQTMSAFVTANDPDGDALTFTATGMPPGFTLDADSGLIRGIGGYHGSGSYRVRLIVADGRGGTDAATFTITVHDALFSARRVRFAGGTHIGYAFAADGSILTERSARLARASGASADRRRLWNGRPYLHVVDGTWAGMWLPESAAVHRAGVVGRVEFTAPRRARFAAGTHSGFVLSESRLVSPKSGTLSRDSGASAEGSAVIDGVPYLHIVNGIWAGRWVPEHYLLLSAGAHTAYEREAGTTVGVYSRTLPRASGASAVARVAGPGGWYLAVSNGMFEHAWLRESSAVRRKVALED